MHATKTREGSQSVCRAVLCNGQTAAIIGTNLTVGVAICAMIVVSTSTIRVELRTEIRRLDANITEMRKELSAEIKGMGEELSAEIDGMRTEIKALDGHLRVTEQAVATMPDLLDLAHGVSPESDG